MSARSIFVLLTWIFVTDYEQGVSAEVERVVCSSIASKRVTTAEEKSAKAEFLLRLQSGQVFSFFCSYQGWFHVYFYCFS